MRLRSLLNAFLTLSSVVAFGSLLPHRSRAIHSAGSRTVIWSDDANSLAIDKYPTRQTFQNLLEGTFLPSGPMPLEYAKFQTWNLVQDLCSYLRGIMVTNSLLVGLGVGTGKSSAMYATVLWIIRDGASLLGGLLFTLLCSRRFGHNIKQWRLFADAINNVGITLNMIAPLHAPLFLPLLCAGSICTTMCGIAAGAVNAVITQHWSSQSENTAEVQSKHSAQHTTVSLLGLALSIPFAKMASSVSPFWMWTIYSFLTALHLVANITAVRALALTTLNVIRYKILVAQFIRRCGLLEPNTSPHKAISVPTYASTKVNDRTELSPTSIGQREPLLPDFVHQLWSHSTAPNTTVQSWTSLSKAGRKVAEQIQSMSSSELGGAHVFVKSLGSNTVTLCFRRHADTRERGRGYFEAELLSMFGIGHLSWIKLVSDTLFPVFWDLLPQCGWKIDDHSLRVSGARSFDIATI